MLNTRIRVGYFPSRKKILVALHKSELYIPCTDKHTGPGPGVISMKFCLLINVKMPTTVGILTVMSWKNNILGLTEPKKSRIS